MDIHRSHRASLIILSGPSRGDRYELEAGSTTIGSASTNDIVVEHESVAPTHAVVEHGEHGVTIRDCGSATGTRVNDTGIEAAILREGDLVEIGAILFKLLFEQDLDRAYVNVHPGSEAITVDELTQVCNPLCANKSETAKPRKLV